MNAVSPISGSDLYPIIKHCRRNSATSYRGLKHCLKKRPVNRDRSPASDKNLFIANPLAISQNRTQICKMILIIRMKVVTRPSDYGHYLIREYKRSASFLLHNSVPGFIVAAVPQATPYFMASGRLLPCDK